MELVPLSRLSELLSDAEGCPAGSVDGDLRRALAVVGYPPDASEVTAVDAVAMLEFLDAAVARSTREQRLAGSGGFRHAGVRSAGSKNQSE